LFPFFLSLANPVFGTKERGLDTPFLEAPLSAHADDASSRAIGRVLEQSARAGKLVVFEEAP